MEARAARGQREIWEERWTHRSGPDFEWYLGEPPAELTEVLERGDLPPGAALDLGCGDGVAVRYLARFFRPAVGMDLAEAAIRQAASVTAEGATPPAYVVGAAPRMPFAREAFAFIFDRGCLQHLPRNQWGRYFSEVESLLVPGGRLQLFVSRGDTSGSGLRRVARAVAGRLRSAILRGRPRPSVRLLRRMLPPGIEDLEAREFPFRTRRGKLRRFVYLLAAKR